MHLIPNEGWWIAAWYDEHISIDICTPPTLIDGEWHYTDLELDPMAFSDGRVEIDDEFADACNSGLIPPNEAIKARTTTTEIEQYLRDQTEPFGRVGWNKFDEALRLALPPIQVLRHISTA
jgi:predicted RNA-binding protein associated with RNAse of E/G family